MPALTKAVMSDDEEAVKQLLNLHTLMDVNLEDGVGSTFLSCMCCLEEMSHALVNYASH